MTRLLLLLGTLACCVSHFVIYCYAPLEATLGLSQKIFYFHLPLAWWGLFSFFLVFLASIYYLKTKSPKASLLALTCSEIGELMAILCVLSGILWGHEAWGVWWTWDPRLTTALILCFIYAGWLILAHLDIQAERRDRLLAVTGILAFLDVPLVFFSARIWRSIHPAVFTSKGVAMAPEMLLTLLFSLVSFGLFWLGLVCFRYKLAELGQRCDLLLTTSIAEQKDNL